MQRWTLSNTGLTDRWMHRGTYIGDDCMVTVSPKIWEEFFLPYNNRLSRENGHMVSYQAYHVDSVPIEEAVNKLRLVDPKGEMVRAAKAVGICLGD